MSQGLTANEFSLPVEFDNFMEKGIGLPPKIVLEVETQYQKIIKIPRRDDSVSLTGRIVPVRASYHDRSVVVLPEKWEKAYDISSSSVLCKLIEPSFAEGIKLKQMLEGDEKILPAIDEYIRDKSVVFEGKYIRKFGRIFKIESIDEGTSEAIVTEDTDIEFIGSTLLGDISVGDLKEKIDLSDKGSKAKIQHNEINFFHLNKIMGIDNSISRIKNEVIFPFIDILNEKEPNPDALGGVLLYGPPGCGKTAIANAIAEDLGLYFDPIQIGDLASKYVHQFGKNLKARFDKATEEDGAIILLDEIDAIATNRSELEWAHQRENVNVLLQLLDPKNRSPKVLIFATTNYLSSLDTAVTRSGRFDTKIGIGPPDENGRAAILRSKLSDHSLDSNSVTEGVVQKLAKDSIGYVGADLETLVNKADIYRKTRAREQEKPTDSFPLIKKDITKALQGVTPLCETTMNIEQPSVEKEDLPGSEAFIKQICDEAELMLHPDKFRSDIDVNPSQAFLLYGPPGTGKTSIANTVANELDILFKIINAGELKSDGIGNITKNINKLFEDARLFRPILLFFDEIDSIAQQRSGNEPSWASDSINALLTQFGDTIDNSNMIFIAATNKKSIIDKALLRPGRFGTHIEVGKPELQNIKKQLNQQLIEIPHCLTESQIDTLANSLHKQQRTQADISDFLNNVKRKLVFTTSEGEEADYSLFETVLDELPITND